jgi:cupin superfamily acireductone dioxygenase involved in methionine salvage
MMLYEEHLHLNDKIQNSLDGSRLFGYKRQRIWIVMEKEDILTLPAGI